MLAGFIAGRWFQRPAGERKKLFLRLGLAALGLFVLLRFISYGDASHWSVQKNTVFTVLSFLLLNTRLAPVLTPDALGVLFIILSAARGQASNNASSWSINHLTLFYFIVHLYLIHLILLVMPFAGFSPKGSELQLLPVCDPATGFGLPLLFIYVVWLGVVIALYPLCRWYGRYKAVHPEKGWLRYL